MPETIGVLPDQKKNHHVSSMVEKTTQADLEREIADLEHQLKDAKSLLKHANPSSLIEYQNTYDGQICQFLFY